ncbi:MAG: hypothetical protein U9R72_16995 [Chloroflexota bacterium]|nr:hypothetical protein [Chloroflexota bacterium]
MEGLGKGDDHLRLGLDACGVDTEQLCLSFGAAGQRPGAPAGVPCLDPLL